MGDDTLTQFQLVKHTRPGVDSAPQLSSWSVDTTTGLVTALLAGRAAD